MAANGFFNEQTDQSEVKANIVAKYFVACAKVMLANRKRFGHIDKLGYIDLFAGPGRYADGSKSTPLMVLEQSLATPGLADILATMFNDKDEYNIASLKEAIKELPGLSALKHEPKIYCGEVGADAEAMFRSIKMCPTFSFVDPFGYKGLSRGFIQAMVKDWGCDCVFFFNYGRINAGINNDAIRAHMDALFGNDRIERMRGVVSGMPSDERVTFVLEELAAALRDLGAPYILPFRFKRADGSRTSHALIFVSKKVLGYNMLSRGFIQAMVKDWGCDCVFFFNYGRINAGINNDAIRAHMDALFGNDRIERMRGVVSGMPSDERVTFVLEELAAALRDLGAPYILPFRFKRADGSRTSHALIFVSKKVLGYNIMKQIMAKESSTEDQGVPSFTYSPADARTPFLFSFNQPIAALADDLAARFAGRTMTMKAVHEDHHVNTPFVERNYKRALCELEQAARITADPPAIKRPMRKGERTFGEDVRVTFPSRVGVGG